VKNTYVDYNSCRLLTNDGCKNLINSHKAYINWTFESIWVKQILVRTAYEKWGGGCHFYWLPIHSQFTAIIHLQVIMWVWFSSAELSITYFYSMVTILKVKTSFTLLKFFFAKRLLFVSSQSPCAKRESHSNYIKREFMLYGLSDLASNHLYC